MGTYIPTLKDKTAARLYHELHNPLAPFVEAAHTKTRYDDMKRWLREQGYIWGRAGVWVMQLGLFATDAEEVDDVQA